MRCFRSFSQSIVFLIITTVLLGCATPQVTVNPNMPVVDYKSYKLVYLLTPESKEQDPRGVYPQVARRLKAIGFQVREVNMQNPIDGAQGTGFIIDERGFVLSCAHIFNSEDIATLWIKGKRYAAKVVYTNKKSDLALIEITADIETDLRPLAISKEPVYRMGQTVYTVGFPLSDILGNAPRLNKGLVSSAVGLKDNPDHLQVSVEIQPGNSGSPLLNEEGNLIGIIQGTLNPMNVLSRTGGNLPQNVNFAAKNSVILDFLKEAGKDIALTTSAEKVEFDQASDSIVQVRSGDVSEEFLKQPKLACRVNYQSFWDLWFRFRFFQIEFYDIETGELLLKAGQYRDNPFSSEVDVLNKTFAEIRTYLNP